MSLEFFPVPFWISMTALALSLAVLRRLGRSRARLLAFAAAWVYLTAVIDLTLFPIPVDAAGEWPRSAANILSRVNLIPFDFGGLFDLPANHAIRELGGNVLLGVPFGLGLPFRARFKPRNFPWLALLPGLAIETAQFCLSLAVGYAYRGVDVNDVLLNAAGAGLGFGLFCGLALGYLAAARRFKLRSTSLLAFLKDFFSPA